MCGLGLVGGAVGGLVGGLAGLSGDAGTSPGEAGEAALLWRGETGV